MPASSCSCLVVLVHGEQADIVATYAPRAVAETNKANLRDYGRAAKI